VAGTLNRRFPAETMAHQYFTLLYGILNLKTRRFDFVRAGHLPLIVVSPDNARIQAPRPGHAIGVTKNATFEEDHVQLGPGETVVMYTDGLTETANANRTLFGIDRFLQSLKNSGNRSLPEMLSGIKRELSSYRGEAVLEDDITILAFRSISSK
jgi:sigma-B regulation protein RsbU (phosphoserine phosphatase)